MADTETMCGLPSRWLRWGCALMCGTMLAVNARAQANDAQSLYGSAQRALEQGDVETARKEFAQLSREQPEVAELHATLGAILFQEGSFAASLEELNEARRLKPGLPKLDGLIAMSLSEMGRYEEALPGLVKTFAEAKELPIERMSGLELERAYTALHKDREAVETALAMQRLFPEDAEVLYHDERIFGSFAYATVQRLVMVAPTSIWRHQAQAEALESQGSHTAAIAEYEEILRMDPGHRGIHYRIGRCLRERARDSHEAGDLKQATEEFKAELKVDPGNANAAYEIGELHRMAGDAEAARSSFEAALRIYPDFPEANLGLGTVLATLNQPEAALPYLQKAVTSDAEDQATWYRLAQVYRELGRTADQRAALKEFQRLRKAGVATTAPLHDVSRQDVEGTP